MAAKAGKWAFARKKFSALPEDPSHTEVVRAAQETFRGLTLGELAKRHAEVTQSKQQATNALSLFNVDLEALERLMQDALDAQDITNVTINGLRVAMHTEVTAKVVDPEAFQTWAKEHMADNYSIPYQTLQASVKRDLEAGLALPPGVEVFTYQNVSCK